MSFETEHKATSIGDGGGGSGNGNGSGISGDIEVWDGRLVHNPNILEYHVRHSRCT